MRLVLFDIFDALRYESCERQNGVGSAVVDGQRSGRRDRPPRKTRDAAASVSALDGDAAAPSGFPEAAGKQKHTGARSDRTIALVAAPVRPKCFVPDAFYNAAIELAIARKIRAIPFPETQRDFSIAKSTIQRRG